MPRSLLELPNELIFLITADLSLHDLGSLRLTARDLNSIIAPRAHALLLRPRADCAPFVHWAAYRGYGALIELALSSGIDIEARDLAQRTAIHFAASYKDPSMVKLLLSKGAEIDAKDEMGRTALFTAVSWGLRKTVKVLLDNGADVDVRDRDGETILGVTVGLGVLWTIDRTILKHRLLRFFPRKASLIGATRRDKNSFIK